MTRSPRISPPGLALLTTFGLGYMRPASGTWGSMPTVVLAGAMLYFGAPTWAYYAALICVLVIFSAACIIFGEAAETHFGKKDPGTIVADETAGQCLPLLFLPAVAVSSPTHLLLTLLAAFVIFRIADILKLWPAYGLQKHPFGYGVLLDDLVAGLQALLVVQLLTRLFWPLLPI